LALPFVRVQLDASMTSTLIRLATRDNRTIHAFGGGDPDVRVARESGSASGLGDVLLRGKYRVVKAAGGGLALGVDLRLPTGDEENLLGTGATQVKASLIYSGEHGRFSPHVNVGYTFSSGSLRETVGAYRLGDETPQPISSAPDAFRTVFRGQEPGGPLSAKDLEIPDEIAYTAGFTVQASPRFTLNADVVGRTLLDVNRFGIVSRSFNYREANGGQVLSRQFDDVLDVVDSSANLTLILGVAGVKWNVAKRVLLNASVLFPLSDSGLRPEVTPVVGLDVAF
jgi:hypothetical protein